MIKLGILRETIPTGYQATITIKESTVKKTNDLFLYRKDINNSAVYVNVCSIDDLEKYNSTTSVLYTDSKQNPKFTNIKAMEDYWTDIVTKLSVLEKDYNKLLDDHKIGIEEVITIDKSWT